METFQRLDQMNLFDALSEEELAQWADKFRREYHLRGSEVIRENERATAFYIVDRGELRARVQSDGKQVPRGYFYPGDFFGETGLLTGQPRNATVDVLTDAELLVLDKLDFDLLMIEAPGIRDMLRELSLKREEAGRKRFPWQRPGEVTLFFSKKHWVALLNKLPLPILIGLVGGILSTFYLRYPADEISPLLSFVLLLVGGGLLGLTLFLFIYHFFDWRNDHYIITNLRVLHVERVLLLREDRDEAPIERVQDVQVRREGFWANVLDYGNVLIQTAAATEQVVFSKVANPHYVRDALFSPLLKYSHAKERAEVRESIRSELRQRLDMAERPGEDQKTEQDQASAPAKKAPQEKADVTFDILGLLRRFGQWLRDLFTFETWIYSDGDEAITWRKNGWLLISSSIPPFVTLVLILVLTALLFSQGIGSPGLGLLPLVLVVPVLGWWFYIYWDWQNDIYEIRGNRLIDLKRRPLFLDEIRRETTLDRIENIGLSIPGPVAQLLNYGTVVIETAGEVGAFNFEQVHDPRGVQREVFNRMETYKQRQREAELKRRHGEVAEWFEIYEELRKEQGFPPEERVVR